MNKGKIITIIISVLIIGGAIGAYFSITSRAPKTSIAPDYSLQDLQGANFTLSSLQPKTVLLDFMSVTCIPCKQMYPILADLLNDSDIKDDIEVISLETDETTPALQLEAYAIEHEITWTISFAPSNMTSEYGVTTLPTFVIINPGGNITYVADGIQSYDTLKTEVVNAIQGRGGAQLTSFLGFTIGLAIIVAITSFFSPCSFPLLPGYIAHIIGAACEDEEEQEESQQKSKLKDNLFFPLLGLSGGLGILVSYLILGIIVSAVGSAIKPFFSYVLPIIGGIFIILGIIMFTPLEISFSKIMNAITKGRMKIDNKEKSSTRFNKLLSTFMYGLGYGVASIGCNGPVFLFFSLQVSLEPTIIRMVFDYLAFTGTILFLMVGVTVLLIFSKDVIVQKLKASTAIIKIISGVIMVGVGIYLIIEFILGIVR